jgi:hypothetical protein
MEHEMSGGESRRPMGYKIRVAWVAMVHGLLGYMFKRVVCNYGMI